MTTPPSPARHLAAFGKRYPRTWRQVDEVRAGRGRELPDWLGWCFMPLAGAYAIVSDGMSRLLHRMPRRRPSWEP